MKSVLLGMLGALAVLVAAAVIYPQYSDYRARAQTDGWLFEVEEAQRAIATNAVRKNSLFNSGYKGFPSFVKHSPAVINRASD